MCDNNRMINITHLLVAFVSGVSVAVYVSAVGFTVGALIVSMLDAIASKQGK